MEYPNTYSQYAAPQVEAPPTPEERATILRESVRELEDAAKLSRPEPKPPTERPKPKK